MHQPNVSLSVTFSTFLFLTTQSSNHAAFPSPSSSALAKITFVQYSQVIYLAPLVILGVCGNIICAIVFCTKSLKRIRSSAYLFTLALIDVFFLLDLLPGMIHTGPMKDLYERIHFICNLQTYISSVASFVHIWMVLAFTAERFFAVNFPLKHMSQCTPNFSRAIILIIIVPAFLCYIHPAFFVSEVDEKGQCREKNNYERYMTNLNMIDTIMTMFLPFILVSILNILIIRKLFCSKTFRQHVFANGSRYQCRRTSNWPQKSDSAPTQENSLSVSPSPLAPALSNVPPASPLLGYRSQHLVRSFRTPTPQQTSNLYRTFTNSESSQTTLSHSNPTTTTTNTHSSSNEQQQQAISTLKSKQTVSSKRSESAHRHVLTELRLTKMLLAISLTCLSLNFPSYYLRFMFLYENSKGEMMPEESAPPNTTNATSQFDFPFYQGIIFHYISYLSYSINILIYLLFGGNFRRALKRLFSVTSKQRSENLNSVIRGKSSSTRDKNYGNTYDCDSTVITSTSPNGSLRGYSKSFKLREQASLRRALRQQQLFMSQQKHAR